MLVVSNTLAKTVDVDVTLPKASQSQNVLVLTGTVEAEQHAQLAPLQSGVVEALFVEAGDKVNKGQKLLTLDAKLAELSLKQFKASVAAAKLEKLEAERLYQEMVSLSQKQLVAETLKAERQSAVEIAIAEYNRVSALLAEQKEIVDRHTLYAPFFGVVAKRNINLGEWVTPQMSVFTLVEQDKLRLNIAIPQEYFAQLHDKEDISVNVVPDFVQNKAIEAKLDRLVAVALGNSRTLTGLVNLPEGSSLVAGMSARAEIQLPANGQHIVWLPKTAIKQHPDGGKSVFTVDDNMAKRILIKVVEEQGALVAITGVSEAQSIIISGIELLKTGDKVNAKLIKGQGL
ncbi:efflux transporter, RND family, MFP subunit [Colwellia psychrerythraea]|uniref:Efflux transporter, RND family, MFP subunit n=1 Tax=Colwellia psychrerythraea TaxID=28229 RepID=A0A099L0D6_COLPS|nr:efflux transporter, RND family, MFP subunit [Colwellia psychrerythraea]